MVSINPIFGGSLVPFPELRKMFQKKVPRICLEVITINFKPLKLVRLYGCPESMWSEENLS